MGDGDNQGISLDQIKEVLGGAKIAGAASELGTSEGALLDGITGRRKIKIRVNAEGLDVQC